MRMETMAKKKVRSHSVGQFRKTSFEDSESSHFSER